MTTATAGYQYRASFPGAAADWKPDLRKLAALLYLGWGYRLVAAIGEGGVEGALILESPEQVWWVVGENGGELSVRKINDGAPHPSVPYSIRRSVVPLGSLANWLASTLRGEGFDVDDDSCADLTPADFAGDGRAQMRT